MYITTISFANIPTWFRQTNHPTHHPMQVFYLQAPFLFRIVFRAYLTSLSVDGETEHIVLNWNPASIFCQIASESLRVILQPAISSFINLFPFSLRADLVCVTS